MGGKSHEALTSFEDGRLRIEFVQEEVRVGEVRIHLTSGEYKILASLVGHKGQVLTYQQLVYLGGIDPKNMDDGELRNRVMTAVERLRRKLWRNAEDSPVETVLPGQGYRYRSLD